MHLGQSHDLPLLNINDKLEDCWNFKRFPSMDFRGSSQASDDLSYGERLLRAVEKKRHLLQISRSCRHTSKKSFPYCTERADIVEQVKFKSLYDKIRVSNTHEHLELDENESQDDSVHIYSGSVMVNHEVQHQRAQMETEKKLKMIDIVNQRIRIRQLKEN